MQYTKRNIFLSVKVHGTKILLHFESGNITHGCAEKNPSSFIYDIFYNYHKIK